MTQDNPIAELEISSGAQRGSRLTLYAGRLAYHGGDAMETVPLAHLAAVGVAYERDSRKLNWAIVLLVLALIVLAVSGPLQGGVAGLAASIKVQAAGRESLDSFLLSVFSVLGGLARLLPLLAALLAALAVALLVFFWLGRTTLTLGFAAVERAYSVRGRNPFMVQFAEVVAAQLAARKA